MSGHSRLSPSSRHRWSRCPGSVREEAKYPDTTSEAAADGTRSHSLLTFCLNHKVDPMTLVGTTIDDSEVTAEEFEVDEARAARVKIAWDYVQGRLYWSETRVNPSLLLGRDDLSGTADIIVFDCGVIEIIDYKDGVKPVDAEDNEQMEQYAWGVLATGCVGAETVRMTIIQPKLTAIYGTPAIRSHDVPLNDFLAKKDLIIAQAAATDAPDAPLVPGKPQCDFCKAKGNCSALVNYSFSAIEVEPASLVQSAADKDPASMTNEQLSKVLEAAPLVKAMIAAAEAEVLKRIQDGERVPGFKLVNGRGSREWALSDDEIAKKLSKMGVPKASIYKTKLVSVAQAEELTWVKQDVKQRLTPRQLKLMRDEYVVTKAGKLTVVPESDSRKAVNVEVGSLFNEVLPDWLIKPEN